MSITADSYKAAVGERIELFAIDATDLTDDDGNQGSVFYFVSSANTSSYVRWKTLAQSPTWTDYTPIDITGSGFEISSQGSLPRPTLKVSNVKKSVHVDVIDFHDLLGAAVYRWVTLKKYLGGETYANFDQHWPVDIFYVERKTTHNKFFIEWELNSQLDFQGQKIPKRQLLRDVCMRIYRRWNGSQFIYTPVEAENGCPYGQSDWLDYPAPTGATMWDIFGNPVAQQSADKCGRHVADCKKRFPIRIVNGKTVQHELPMSNFPGMTKNRGTGY